MHKLERTSFETSRAAEYFDARELQAQTGQLASNFATVALKELVDNALDASETVGVAPVVSIEVREEGELIRLSVSDNGTGIPPEVVRKVLNFDTRTSDKAAYRSPTRGAQGKRAEDDYWHPACFEMLRAGYHRSSGYPPPDRSAGGSRRGT